MFEQNRVINNVLIEKLEFKNKNLYIFFRNYYKYSGEEIYFNKILCFKDVKSFTYTLQELAHSFEFLDYLNSLGIEFFSKVFYRNKKTKKIYIFDANFSMTLIEFNDQKEWNYREQKN